MPNLPADTSHGLPDADRQFRFFMGSDDQTNLGNAERLVFLGRTDIRQQDDAVGAIANARQNALERNESVRYIDILDVLRMTGASQLVTRQTNDGNSTPCALKIAAA